MVILRPCHVSCIIYHGSVSCTYPPVTPFLYEPHTHPTITDKKRKRLRKTVNTHIDIFILSHLCPCGTRRVLDQIGRIEGNQRRPCTSMSLRARPLSSPLPSTVIAKNETNSKHRVYWNIAIANPLLPPCQNVSFRRGTRGLGRNPTRWLIVGE